MSPSKKTASSARAGANPPSAGKDTAPSAAPKLNDKVTTPLRSSSRIRKPSAKQQALLDAALASDSDDAEIAQGVFIGARKDKAAANKAALEEFPPLPKRLLSRTDPAVHPASLRRSVTPEDARSQRPLPRRKRQDKTSSSPRKANTKVSQDVISLHDTDSEMGEAIDPDANARSLLDVEAQESGSEANGSDDETNLEGVFEETEEDRLFIDDRSDGDLSLHGSSSADEKPIVDRKGKRVLRDSMSPEQVPTSKKARKQVAALPAPTSSGGSRPQIKELPNKSTITRKTPIDTVRSGARRATPSAAADREKDDDEYYAAYGPPLKNNGPYVSSKPSPALLASPIASSSRRSMAVPSTSSSPIKRDRCRQDASSGRSAWNNSPSTSVVDIDDETLPQSPRSNRADKPASRQVTSSKTEERDQSRSERSGRPSKSSKSAGKPAPPESAQPKESIEVDTDSDHSAASLAQRRSARSPEKPASVKLESPPPVINDDAHLGPKDNPWLSDFYATLPSIPEVVFEKTAKNRLERSDDHILSPARMKDALLELPHGKAYVKRLRYLLTMMSYKTIVNPVTVSARGLRLNVSSSTSQRYLNVSYFSQPSRQLSNNACFLATGQTVYCYVRQPASTYNSYSHATTHDHRVAIQPFQHIHQRSMTGIANALGLSEVVTPFHNGFLPFTTRSDAGLSSESTGNVTASPKKTSLLDNSGTFAPRPSGANPLEENIKRHSFPLPIQYSEKSLSTTAATLHSYSAMPCGKTCWRLPIWADGDVPDGSLVTVGYTINSFTAKATASAGATTSTNAKSPAGHHLSFNLQFILVHTNPIG